MRRMRGFTLLEVLVAVALLALLGVAASLTLNSSLLSGQLIGSRIEELERLQRAHTLLRRDLEQMVARRGRTEQGDARDQALIANASHLDDSDGVLLDFYKGGRRILGRVPPSSHLERVRYRWVDGQLLRDVSPYVDAPAGERWYSAVLLEEIDAVTLRLFDRQRWVEQWPPLDADQAENPGLQLPEALTLTLEAGRFGSVPLSVLLPEAL